MPNTREKLIELLETVVSPKEVLCDGEVLVSTAKVADHLIANGVVVSKMETATIATDNPVGCNTWGDGFKQGYEDGFKVGYNADKWIPVTERLPDKPGRYLICEEFGRVMIAGWDTSCWFGGHSYSEFTVYKATHWMPLPKPPEGE